MFRSLPSVPTRLCLPANPFVRWLLKAGIVVLVLNEVRGSILAAPILYGIYAAGGTWTAMWVGFCSLAGIALSVIAPLFVFRKFKLRST